MALTMLQYGLINQAAITVITGEVGSGKTTLIRKLLNEIDDDITVGLISNTHKSFGDLLQWVSMAFNLEYKGKDKVSLYDDFVSYVVNEYAKSRRTVLIIDEAQNLSPSVLEELRMLSNINADKDQVLQLILVGQPELRETLCRQDLRQFAQRVSADYHIAPLELDEAVGYIRHRVKVAGGNIDLFEIDACKIIWKYTGGIPRLINTICDTALVYAYADQLKTVSRKLAAEVIIEKQKGGIFPIFGNDRENRNITA